MQTPPELPQKRVASETEQVSAAQIPALEPYVEQLVINKAVELARAGHYQQAEDLLSGLQRGKDQPSVLDLLARMRAQQGRWLEAEAYWKQALEKDPTNPAYQEGLRYIQRTRRPPILHRFLLPVLLGLIILLLALLFIIPGASRLTSLEGAMQGISGEVASLKDVLSQPRAPVVLPTQVIPTFPVGELTALRQAVQDNQALSQAGMERLQQQIIEMRASHKELLESLQTTPPAPLKITLDVAGVQVLAREGSWMVQFTDGLFPYGWALSQSARQTLDELSLQLTPYAGKVEVSIIGFKSSDEQDEYFDLGLMRSVVVVDYLLGSAQLPADLFNIRPQGSLPSPFPNDTIANRARNRTVILMISPKFP